MMKTGRMRSIKTRITLVLVLLPLISLGIVGGIAIYENQNALLSQAQSNLKQLIYEKSIGYDHIFQRITQEALSTGNFVKLVYSYPVPKNNLGTKMLFPWTGNGYGSKEFIDRNGDEILKLQRVGLFLKSIVDNNQYITLGYMGSESGITVFSDEGVVKTIEEIEGFDARKRPWYLEAKKLKRTIWTNPYVDANTKKMTITCATPIFDVNHDFLGVVGFDVLLDTIRHDIISMRIGYKGLTFMVDKQGNVVVPPGVDEKDYRWKRIFGHDNYLRTKNNAFNHIVSEMVNGKSGIGMFKDSRQKTYFLSYAPIITIMSGVGIIVPREQIVEPVQESGKLIIVALTLIIIIALILGMILSNQITRPLEELTVAVDKVSRGLTDIERIEVKRQDEIGTLARSFNRLMETVSVLLKEKE